MSVETHKETMGFRAEVKQLLDLMIHSLYSNKEIFLRELISNASDAIDRLRFAALSDDDLLKQDSELNIHVVYDKDARTITVTDNGIGMTREEVIENIGTIAKSGTHEFLESLTGDQQKDANLIGQFGVGFYSSFVVADRVTLTTRRAGMEADHGVRWGNPMARANIRLRLLINLNAARKSFCTCARVRMSCWMVIAWAQSSRNIRIISLCPF